MATPIVRFPELNPVKFVRATNAIDLFFDESIPFFETQMGYYQKFQTSDFLQFQVIIKTSVINKYGMIVQLRDSTFNRVYGTFQLTGDAWVYLAGEVSLNYRLNLYSPLLPEGDYYIYCYMPYVVGSDFELFYSEPLTVKTTHAGTIAIKYGNEGNDFDMFFFNDHNGSGAREYILRCNGGFRSDGFQPGSVDAMFNDQSHNQTMLSSTPFNVEKLTIGSNQGEPNWIINKANRALSCTNFYLDGIQYCKADGAKLERKQIANNHPMSGWQIDVIKSDNSFVDTHSISHLVLTPVGIGTAVINDTFVITPTINDNSVVSQPIPGELMRPHQFSVPGLVAGVVNYVVHNLAHTEDDYIWQVQGETNEAALSECYADPLNIGTRFIVKSEVDIPAGTLKIKIA